jgi:hypothetical protein
MARRGVIIDTVVVAEDSQRYAVRDATQITRPIDGGATTGIEGNLLIDVQRDGLVHGTDIVQSFDAIPANDGSRISGTLFRLFKNVAYRVSFALSRVSLTPGMCRPK